VEPLALPIRARLSDYPGTRLARLTGVCHASRPAGSLPFGAVRRGGVPWLHRGPSLHRLTVRNIHEEYNLRSREQRLRDVAMLTLSETARRHLQSRHYSLLRLLGPASDLTVEPDGR
jgi:hypothetical protein